MTRRAELARNGELYEAYDVAVKKVEVLNCRLMLIDELTNGTKAPDECKDLVK